MQKLHYYILHIIFLIYKGRPQIKNNPDFNLVNVNGKLGAVRGSWGHLGAVRVN